MFENNFKMFCWLLIFGFASLAIGSDHGDKIFEDGESKEECMKELNITAEQIEEMEDADAPIDKYNCFVGCYLLRDEWITENGQLNKTKAAEEIASEDDNDVKLKLQRFFHDFDEDLKAKATDTCSAGKVAQKQFYTEDNDEEN
ncbi:uncharacterized protein LOC129565883 [Sitodiplosis mosellana]|uniref:uncharacterized protein LOC129565883 n=1 Tax=Sitodiplosis mosellana TaxID=263140 RepID=UPI002444E7FB|nr:uncharacterized protein LOC129565883 [Sitodiplosis mosellana]